jgi:raffinose/stachyose/melibiose transport system permease protein
MTTGRREAILGRALLLLLMAITILPFVSLFVTALHESGTYPTGIEWPDDPHWGNFRAAFDAAKLGSLLYSTTLIVLGVVPAALLFGTMAGFALGQLRMRGHRLVFLVFLLGLTLPFEGIVIPLYYQMRDLGLLNTRWAIVLPLVGLFMPFSVVWMRAHFVNWRIHVPMARPAVASLAILLFLWTWNQFLLAIVLVDDPTKRTMAGALGAFQGQWGTNIPLLCAGSLLILAPTLLVFFAFQRQFVSALLAGAVKA